MHARLKQGPGDGKDFDVGENPSPTAFLCAGGRQFPAEVHRYQFTDVNRAPNAPEPRATYQHAGRVN